MAISWDWRSFTRSRGEVQERTTESLGERRVGFLTLQGTRSTITYSSGAANEWEEWTTDRGGVQVVVEQRIATAGSEGELIRVRAARLGSVEPVPFDAAFFSTVEPGP